jgi:hypothetical protein
MNYDDQSKKRRGRPPKNAQKIDYSQKMASKGEENIVLRLALSDSDDSCDDNHFTANDEFSTKKYSTIKSLSDADDTMNSSLMSIGGSNDNSKNTANTVKTLIDEVKKRDQIIEVLRNRTGGNTCGQKASKNMQITYHHTNVIDVTSGKQFTPKCTDHKCWWCDEGFTNLPAFIVQFFREGVYYVFGNFCSFNCALVYNMKMLNDYKLCTRHSLTISLKTKTTGESGPIKMAGDREILKSKGGIVNIDKFRDGFTIVTEGMRMNFPPLIPLVHAIENYDE